MSGSAQGASFSPSVSWLAGAGIGAITIAAAWGRAHGLCPDSLFFDDEWVGVVVRAMSLSAYFELLPALPPGFVVLEKAFAALSSDPAWPLLVFPAACSVILIPLVAALIREMGGAWPTALLGAGLMGINPAIASFANRAKPYSLDAVAATVLLLIGLSALQRSSPRRHAALAGTGFLFLLCSYPSALVSGTLLHLTPFAPRGQGARALGAKIAVTLAFDAAALTLYFGILRHQSSEALTAFWQGSMIPRQDPVAALRFIGERTWHAAGLAFYNAFWWLELAVVPGIAFLARRRGALAGAFFPLLYLAAVAAAIAHAYPFGALRVNLYLSPLLVALASIGCEGVVRLIPWRPRPWVGLAAATLAIGPLFAIYPLRYPYRPFDAPTDLGHARLVTIAERSWENGAHWLLYPKAEMAAAYYAGRRLTFLDGGEKSPQGFVVRLDRPRVFHLQGPGIRGSEKRPELLTPPMRRFLDREPGRVVFLATHLTKADGAIGHIVELMREAGYRIAWRRKAPDGLVLFFRRDAPDRAAARRGEGGT